MFQALRNRNVALIFSAHLISVAGDLVLFIALPFWIYQLTGSAMATGFMFAALTLPQLLLSPLAGVFVDRLDRKRLMIASDLIRAALVACYVLVNTADQVWIIYLLAFAESAVSQFFRPSVTAVIPTLVSGEEELTRANAALGASYSAGKLIGPALGGLLVASLGPHGAALFDAVSYVLSAALLLVMHVPNRQNAAVKLNDARQAVSEIARELMHGVRVVWDRSVLRIVILSIGVLMLSQGIINVLLVVMIQDIWHVGAQELGYIITAEGIGGIIGTLAVGAIAARMSAKNMIIGGGVIAGLVLMAMVNQPSVYVAMGLIAFAGISIVAFDVGLTTLLQLGSDDENRGRVASLMQTVMAASQLISIGATSLLADKLGAVLMLDIAALMFILGGAVVIFAPSAKAPDKASLGLQPAE